MGKTDHVIIIKLDDEIARRVTSEQIKAQIEDFIRTEACVNSEVAATILGIHPDEFRSRHSKKLPVVELGSGRKGNRYRMADIIAYRDKHVVMPKERALI